MPSRDDRDSPARRQRRRRTHQRVDSNSDLLPDRRRERRRDDDATSPTRNEPRRQRRRESSSKGTASDSTGLSSGQLAKLDQLNRKLGGDDNIYATRTRQDHRERRTDREDGEERERVAREADRERRRQEHKERKRRRQKEEAAAAGAAAAAGGAGIAAAESKHRRQEESGGQRRRSGRIVSGQTLERGNERYYSDKEPYRDDVRRRDGDGSSNDSDFEERERKRKKRKKIFIGVGAVLLLLAIIIPVAVVLSSKGSSGGTSGGAPGSSNATKPTNGNLAGMSQSDIPQSAQGGLLDPFAWYDTNDFNVTYTTAQIGGLSIMGLNDTWDDTTRANDKVPALKDTFAYGTMPIRGVNIGGWLSLEPFITPSLFSGYSTHDNVVDEYTLTSKLGSAKAKSVLEQHYSSFVSEQTFADIQAAGFDHVRIPYSYWAVKTYDGDPYVSQVAWRYLLRGIEWARKHGLRVNLDLHGAPGSQNGWNHSGRQGPINWLNGTDGDTNGQRTIDIHTQLATFFTQPRYKKIITMYGLVNEPRMTALPAQKVLSWSQTAITSLRQANFTGIIIFGDGFMGLDKWQGQLQNNQNLLLDVHQYVIFNVDQLVLNHHDKINFACGGWTQQTLRSQNTATGFGPTLCGEWSQADTDCAPNLNNVGVGSRWEGTLNLASSTGVGGSKDGSVLSPTCPSQNRQQCSCDQANADPGSWSAEYKQWLLMFAEAQMHSFEQGWGWFYWTWQTESAAQWSYKSGMAAGVLPKLAYERIFDCSQNIPDFASLGLSEDY
ncbi:hypothetical protein B0A48_05526 [Cryoendolithus antarcticus]|uniref:glucan 1,3-beta-glucosidase n=1 Tax=Cryoendolithus antarcticus TaxID=1507870 RepID=A0A1V8TIR8_9PEZI|nr:hypothetical protein B0A48_05526 [Cryoendolithus antarcticus]